MVFASGERRLLTQCSVLYAHKVCWLNLCSSEIIGNLFVLGKAVCVHMHPRMAFRVYPDNYAQFKSSAVSDNSESSQPCSLFRSLTPNGTDLGFPKKPSRRTHPLTEQYGVFLAGRKAMPRSTQRQYLAIRCPCVTSVWRKTLQILETSSVEEMLQNLC